MNLPASAKKPAKTHMGWVFWVFLLSWLGGWIVWRANHAVLHGGMEPTAREIEWAWTSFVYMMLALV
ncbi:MAG TPA: hypothetical protein VL588_06365, partial [Bdellovibrionota bacterium]|nr:hypothetical protein [Bdellovibrionota bacterium]